MVEEAVSLECLYSLDLIIRMINEKGSPLSRTRLKNRLSLKDDLISRSLEYGCTKHHLVWEEGNFYSVKKDFIIQEERFYPAVKVGLEKLWESENYQPNEYYVEETARKDSKIAGPWTRPDFTLISHKKFSWTIGYEFDVVTFEVKRPDSCNVLAVFEALSHTSAATRAYVVFPINTDAWSKAEPEQEARVKDECSKHGVGLILLEDIYKEPRPIHLIKARKREIDHEKCSSFLNAVISPDGKNRISAWK